MSYYLFLDKTLLPIPSARLQLKVNNKNKTLNLINEGEVNVLKTPGLTEISFEVLLPNSLYPFATYFGLFRKAEYYLNRIEQLKISNKPFQFIFCRMSLQTLQTLDILHDTNITVALEDYEITEDAKNGRDMMVRIKLKQYKPYATKVLSVQTAADGTKTASVAKQRRISREVAQAYKVVAKQTLWEICKKQLGDGVRWQDIAKLNDIFNPNDLSPGQVIKFVK